MYDARADEVRLEVDGRGAAGGAFTPTRASLLLNAHGGLVGVDLGGSGLQRMLVMVGEHEDVADVRDATVAVAKDGANDPWEVQIAGAKRLLRVP